MGERLVFPCIGCTQRGRGPGAVGKVACAKFEDCGFEHHSGIQFPKNQKVSSPFTLKKIILWGASVTEG